VTIETSGRLPATRQISPTSYAPPKVSWEDYLRWARANEFPSEWVDGEIIEIMPPSIRHQLLIRFLLFLVSGHVDRGALGLVVQDVLMRLDRRPRGRAPDVLFLASAHSERNERTHINGPADLVVEVVSPESEVRDRRQKFLEYQEAGIPEYWLIDEPRSQAYFFELGEDDKYHQAVLGENGIYESAVLPGLRIRVDWLWRDPLPTLDEALAELPE